MADNSTGVLDSGTPTTRKGTAQARETAWVDYASEMKISSNPVTRMVYAGLGSLAAAMALIGLVVPGWPTTVWLLIAAFLFSKSSPRFYNMILNHRIFGPIVRDYRAGNGIPAFVKYIAISCVALFAGLSAFLLISNIPVRIIVVAVACFGIGFLVGVPTRKPYEHMK